MIMRSVHSRLRRKDNPILLLLGGMLVLVIFCVVVGLTKVSDIFKSK